MVEFSNRTKQALVPVVSYRALDKNGRALDVRVRTAYGSDAGRLVVPSGNAYDILIFEGAGADQVRDVQVEIELSHSPAMASARRDVTLTLLYRGQPADKFAGFDGIALANPNQEPVTARVVGLIYDHPRAVATQQIQECVELVRRVEVPAGESAAFAIAPDHAGRGFHSVKVHLTP